MKVFNYCNDYTHLKKEVEVAHNEVKENVEDQIQTGGGATSEEETEQEPETQEEVKEEVNKFKKHGKGRK